VADLTPLPPRTVGGPDLLAIGTFRLTVVSGPDAGAEFSSSSERVVVGTHPTADFRLSDRAVSRFHCELSVDERGVRLRDLDSRNGIQVENVWLETARLSGPVVLQLGNTQLRFQEIIDSVQLEITDGDRFGGLIGNSSRIRSTFALLERAAASEDRVLLEGEAGAGKSLAAASLHEHSKRSDAGFGVVDCGAPESMVHSELFGSEDTPSALVLCDGGTLVLDDVGALTYDTQRLLLEVLEHRALADRGRSTRFDTRIVSTSRRNLRRDVNAGTFEVELYAMLAARRIRLPSLREHSHDIPALVSHFAAGIGADDADPEGQLMTIGAIDELRAYRWPGNVEELRRHVERCVVLGRTVAPPETPAFDEALVVDTSIPLRRARAQWIKEFERRYLRDMLARTDGNVSAAARKADIDRVHMYRLLKAAGLR